MARDRWRRNSTKGFRAAGIMTGLKPFGAPNRALIFSETEAIALHQFFKFP
nr:hypothetical protein [Hydrococcus rivularis]